MAEAISVGELTQSIKDTLNKDFSDVFVTGEISGYRGAHGSGHVYTTLKDSKAQISLVIWRSTVDRLRFRLEEGMEVNIRGNVDVYGPRGTYQLIVKSVEPKGLGELQLAFRQLCERLQKEGLFDKGRKRAIPQYPRGIGIVTAPTGAAIRDMLHILQRRDPRLKVVIYPARVQGEGAKEQIAAGIEYLNANAAQLGLDLLIVGRGGGSLEDLWAFNEELVARAIFNSELPVVSAVGHEIDTTVADYVADMRAATPSEAAELVTPEVHALLEYVEECRLRFQKGVRRAIDQQLAYLDQMRQRLTSQSPRRQLQELTQTLDYRAEGLERAIKGRLREANLSLGSLANRLEGLSPLRVLQRGYSVARSAQGQLVKSIADVTPGSDLRLTLPDGDVYGKVERIEARDLLPGSDHQDTP